MKTGAIAVALAAGLALSGCASMQRLTTYKGQAQAQIEVQGRRMNVWVHPTDPTLVTIVTVGDAASGGFVRGLTLGLAGGFKPDPRAIDAALAAWLAPIGCRTEPVVELGRDNINFEAQYSCPAGTDLRTIVRDQSGRLMTGAPIQPPVA